MDNFELEELDLEQANKLLERYTEEVTAALDEKTALKKKMDELEAEFYKMRAEHKRVEERLEADRTNKRLLEKRKVQLLRQAENEAERQRLAEEFESASKRFDELTATAYWREFAYTFQIEGAKRLAVAKRAICGDKRGLGKTLTSICYMDMLQAKKVLIVAINDVCPQFAAEVAHWAPHRPIVTLNGLPPAQRSIIYPTLAKMSHFTCLINYEAWRRDKSVIDDLLRLGLDTVIVDEAHKMKEWNKLTARGIAQVVLRPNHCKKCGAVDTHLGDWATNGLIDYKPMDSISYRTFREMTCKSCGADFDNLDSTVTNVLPMTGTPILNKPQEIFSMLHICYPNLFPSESDFLLDYCRQINNRWVFLSGGESRLANSIKEFFVQRSREDTDVTVPPPAITIHELEKDTGRYPLQFKAEREMANASKLVLDEMGNGYNFFYMLEVITRLRQCMTWPNGIVLKIKDPESHEILDTIRFDVKESQKLDAVEELLKDLVEEDERSIVFSQFKEPLYELQRRIGNQSVIATGDQSDSFRAQVLEDFDLKTYNNDPGRTPKWSVALCTYKAFSTGLNLNAARHVILLDDEWNPGMQDQAIGRIDRINSVDQANVHIFRIKESIDDFMAGLMEQKRNMVEGMEGAVSAADMFNELKEFLGG